MGVKRSSCRVRGRRASLVADMQELGAGRVKIQGCSGLLTVFFTFFVLRRRKEENSFLFLFFFLFTAAEALIPLPKLSFFKPCAID